MGAAVVGTRGVSKVSAVGLISVVPWLVTRLPRTQRQPVLCLVGRGRLLLRLVARLAHSSARVAWFSAQCLHPRCIRLQVVAHAISLALASRLRQALNEQADS